MKHLSPLIAADDLIASIDQPNLVIVDTRWYLGRPGEGRTAFVRGHIPHAVYADLETDLAGPTGGGRHPLPTPQAFEETLARLGIHPTSRVVVYDDRGGAVASRLWWMLTDQGHTATQILDGGIGAWVDAGGTLTAELAQPSGGDRFVTSAWQGTATIDEVDATVGPVVDARAADRYQGHIEPIDPKRGHVPGAINLPYETNLTEGRFAESDRLRANLVGAGFDHQTIVHCGSGVTACHLIVAAELAGLPRPKLFVGSWSEWSSTDRSVATGPTP